MRLMLSLFICAALLGPAAQTVKLHEVQRIHIGEMGKTDEAERFRLLLEEQLAKKGFTVVETPDQADAILVGVLTVRVHEEDATAQATVYLKTKDGVKLWWGDSQPSYKWNQSREAVKARAEAIAKKLKADWEKSKKP